MIKYNKQIMKQGKCSVCNNHVMIDEIGNGETCFNCGWIQDSASKEIPHQISLMNLITLDKARKLFAEGKPLESDFYDVIEFCDTYGDIEFSYLKTKYCIVRGDNDTLILYKCGNEVVNLCEYSFDEFAEKASIEGILLKDLWGKIRHFEWVS